MLSAPGPVRTEADLLRSVVDKVSAMLAYWDSAQRCRFANRAYERWFGVSPEALIGQHISELLGPIYELNRPYIEGALRGEPQEFEREIPDPKGGPSRHSLANYIPDIIDGVVYGFYVLVTDISERKRAELALKESEARFSGIISISPDAIVSVDEDRRITIFNEGAETIFGYTKAEAIGCELEMLLPARLHEAHRQHVGAFLAGAETSRRVHDRSVEIVGVRKNGEEFAAEAAISRLRVGPKTLLTVALRDITERKRIEMEQWILAEAGVVLASSLNYEQTLTGIAQLVVRHLAEICVIDMLEDDATVRRITVAHADPAKASVAEALATMPLDARHTLARTAIETRQAQVYDDISSEFLEAAAQDPEHLRALRELAPRSAIVVPLISSDGVLGALIFASSRPHRFGARDLGLATELARRAALAIVNSRLYEAEQRATRARDEVMGIVAHDVRSPLHSIRLAAQLLERKISKSDLRVHEYAASIVRSVDRADRLIEDLLDITRMEAGTLALELSELAVGTFLGEALGSQRLLASEASHELRIVLDEDLPPIRADSDRLLQVLENLVGNAIKFTPDGGTITVSATHDADEVRFSVADTGAGIPAQSLPHIFDRFWQARRAGSRGAGLGLAICKGIVEAHGGRIWVESTEGRGSTFSLTIPAAVDANASCHESATRSA